MSIYVMLPTTHMDDLKIAKLKKALSGFTSQPAVRTGLDFWIAHPDGKDTGIAAIAVLCQSRNHLSALLDISRDARISLHLATADDGPPAQAFVQIATQQANDCLDNTAKTKCR